MEKDVATQRYVARQAGYFPFGSGSGNGPLHHGTHDDQAAYVLFCLARVRFGLGGCQ